MKPALNINCNRKLSAKEKNIKQKNGQQLAKLSAIDKLLHDLRQQQQKKNPILTIKKTV